MSMASKIFKKGDKVSTWRGKGTIKEYRLVGGIPFVAIKYDNGFTVGTNDLKSIKKRKRKGGK